MGAIIGAAVRALLASSVAKWLAWKSVVALLVTSVLGIVLYNLVTEIVGELFQFVQSQMSQLSSQGLSGVAIQLTGLGAWIGERLKVPEQVALMVSFVCAKWAIVKIPFLKW